MKFGHGLCIGLALGVLITASAALLDSWGLKRQQPHGTTIETPCGRATSIVFSNEGTMVLYDEYGGGPCTYKDYHHRQKGRDWIKSNYSAICNWIKEIGDGK